MVIKSNGDKYTEFHSTTVQLKIMANFCVRPCFGFFLQGSAKATAIVNSFAAVALMVIFTVGLVNFLDDWVEPNVFRRSLRYFFWSFYYFSWLLEIGLSLFLYRATILRNYRHCWFWLLIQFIYSTIWLAVFSFHQFYVGWPDRTALACFWVVFIYKVYSIWVIKSFAEEVYILGVFNEALSKLTDADLEEFEKGHGSSDPSDAPYDREFEIPLKDLNDRSMWIEIGSGQFGTVYKAILTKNVERGYITQRHVAIKTLNTLAMADILYFKALLGELKIMTFIGQHENIVNLIGANTTNIRERKLDLIVEFCHHGNIESFLLTRRGIFKNQVDSQGLFLQNNYDCVATSDCISTRDLLNWSIQTVRGIEYLHQKLVIHGDIAARNVLLTLDKVAKISDFGLSRRIHTYKKNYVKNLAPKVLPWRWCAPELLNTKDCRFSRMSDVWSFGITIYEYFSLGGIPYSLFQEYNVDFLTHLQTGNVLQRPNYCPLSVYEIMTKCWKVEPEERSKLSDMIPIFETILNECNEANANPCGSVQMTVEVQMKSDAVDLTKSVGQTERNSIQVQVSNLTLNSNFPGRSVQIVSGLIPFPLPKTEGNEMKDGPHKFHFNDQFMQTPMYCTISPSGFIQVD